MAIELIILFAALPFTDEYRKIVSSDKSFDFKDLNPYSALSQEVPAVNTTLIPPKDPKMNKILEVLKPIVGFFPIDEQKVLFESIDYSSIGFFSQHYSDELKLILDKGNNLINIEQISFSEMLSANARRFRAGLNCFRGVDYFNYDYASSNIRDMLYASNQFNHCQKDFYQVLFTTLNRRKELLLLINDISINSPPTQPEDDVFTRNATGYITGIKYTKADIDVIVNGFKPYAICHQTFNSIIHRLSLESLISLGNWKGYGDVNLKAGLSSREYETSSLNFKNDELIGINKGQGIRTDQRTQNNYLLNYGYKLGMNMVEFDSQTKPNNLILPLPLEWQIKLLSAIEIASKLSVTNLLDKLKNRITRRPFADLAFIILETADSPQSTTKYNLKEVIKRNECSGSYIIECKTLCALHTGQADLTQKDLESIDISPKFPYREIEHRYIAIMCNNNRLSVYSEGFHKNAQGIFDFFEGNQSFGGANADVSQACFGVFTSGGKNDKDACRGVMRQQCGIEVDSQCKERGLYDYINQNPPARAVLPSVCKFIEDKDNFECFKFLSKHFIGGTLSIKPGSFLSYSLHAQIEANGGDLQVPPYYVEPEIIAAYPIQLTIDKVKARLFYVEGNVNDQFTDDNVLLSGLYIDSATYLQFSFVTLLAIAYYLFS